MSDTEQIEIYFCQKFNLYQSLPQKKDQNERCVEKFLNGFSDEEVRKAIQNGCIPVTFGPNILRTETAAIVSVAIVTYEFRDA